MTNAFHSSSAPDLAYTGEPAGFVVAGRRTARIYFAGDTTVFGDMQLIARLYEPDVAVLPIGDHFTMGPEEAALALELLGNPRCVPCHWGTFPLLTGTPDELAALTSAQVDRIEPGDTVAAVRERWFGATGRRVPEIALEGELELDDALVLDALEDDALRAAHDAGPAGRRAGGDRRGGAGRARAAGGRVRARHRPQPARARPDRADVWLSRSSRPTRSRRATSTAGQWGVATQSKFLAVGSVVPWAEPGVGAVATQAYANPRYGPDGLALLRDGASAEDVGRGADRRPTTAASTARSASSTPSGGSATFTGSECFDWAGGRTGPVLRRAGQHPRRRGDGRGARDDVHRDGRTAARRAAARVPCRGAGGRRRPPRPAVGGAARRRARRRLRGPERRARRPARRRPRAARRGARAAVRQPSTCSSARHRARTGSTSTTSCAPS